MAKRLYFAIRGLVIAMICFATLTPSLKKNHLFQPKKKKKTAINSLKKFFQARLVDNEWARGIYRPKRLNLKKCSRPSFFSLILANGDVHPCNAVEYTHDPIMGNTKINSFKEIWMNKKYNDFRSKNFWYCKYCPMNLKIKLRFK